MSKSASIHLGQVDGYSWIRICGKADLFLASKLKKVVEKLISLNPGSSPKFIVDMEDCTGMDSTFMGTLASFAIKLKGIADSRLRLYAVTQKNIKSLEELGLDTLIEINPDDAELSDQQEKVHSKLCCWDSANDLCINKDLILNSHLTLGNLNENNKQEFAAVIKSLEE